MKWRVAILIGNIHINIEGAVCLMLIRVVRTNDLVCKLELTLGESYMQR